MSVLKIDNISKSFGRKKILDNINLEVSAGMYGLLGANGAGKTTLMRIITTLLKPNSGKIVFDDIDSTNNPAKMRQSLGYLPQQFGSYRNITSRECLDYIGVLKGLYDKSKRYKKIDALLEQVNLIEYRDVKLKNFSGGMIRRLGIAQALLGNPRLLIIDEPTAGLDPEERIRFRSLIRNFSQNRTVLLSTHIVEDIKATCTGVAILKNCKIQYFTSMSELASMALNKVWHLSVLNDKEYEHIEKHHTIISTQIKPDKSIDIRVVSDVKPTENAISVEPSIEEGYIICNNK